ncbi:hypothetical protein CLV62_12064 [Dysgonomonas alginatilytica]|uniref:Uncharacterized protein n=1 Tax=Dysgonomonas alginatilytica TaxID=1605892 RepID=A0A2V3PNW7_9BACT|nr:hypothetical protein [Dysgonomonas alginatilytica]PXV62375.1 hypothetical protein CLV62_12064 [Dysgonomonas alginatilytica]
MNTSLAYNPRFPHQMSVKRALKDEYGTPLTDLVTGEEIFEPVFESICGLRDMVRGLDIDAEVIKADYKLSLPKHTFIIRKGDYVTFTNNTNGEVKEGKIEEAKVFNLGANVWFNENGNG